MARNRASEPSADAKRHTGEAQGQRNSFLMSITRSERVVLHSEPDFSISYDETDLGEDRIMVRVHLDVYHFSKTTFQNIRKAVDKHRPRLPPIIFCQPADDSLLFEKFVSRFGFKFISDCWCEDGLNRRIFVNYRDFDGRQHKDRK